MGEEDKKQWQFQVSGMEGECQLFGVNIFHYDWVSTGKSVIVRDPRYNQEFRFPIYLINIDGKEKEFAAGEFSNGIWGFYTLKS